MRPFERFAAAGIVALMVGACATMNVSSHIERGADFTQYRTWDWGPADALPTGDPRLDNNPFFKDYLEGAFEKQLATRRFERTTSEKADLLFHYHANISQRFEVNGIDQSRGYCYDNCEPILNEYELGTIVVDAVDTHTNKVVWRGWAQTDAAGMIDNQQRLSDTITRAVTRMMERFPNVL